MSLEYDDADMRRLIAQIGEMTRQSELRVGQALEVHANRVKDAWNSKLYTDGHARRTGRAISYDIDVSGRVGLTGVVGGNNVEVEIGAKRGTGQQAGVVRLLENGSVHNGARGYGAAALHENEADLERGLAQALGDAANGAGL